MSLGKSKEEQDMTTLLARTLVAKEVLEPMQKMGWGHGAPPPPDYTTPVDGQPAPGGSTTTGGSDSSAKSGQPAGAPNGDTAAPVKADATPIDEVIAAFESTKDPETGLYGGKYKTLAEAIKGGRHLAQMANNAFSERDEAARKLAALSEENLKLRQTPASQAAPVAVPTTSASRAEVDRAQAAYDKVLSEIVEEGGLLDAESSQKLSKANRELVDAQTSYRVQENAASQISAKDAEQRKWDEVVDYMGKNHPDAEKFSDEVALFVRGNTPLAKAIDALTQRGDLIGATELAWTSYRTATGVQSIAAKSEADTTREADLAARKEVRDDLKAQALKDAGVIQGSSGGSGVHQGGNQGGSLEQRRALLNRMAIEGDAPGSVSGTEYRRMVIPLPPGLFPS